MKTKEIYALEKLLTEKYIENFNEMIQIDRLSTEEKETLSNVKAINDIKLKDLDPVQFFSDASSGLNFISYENFIMLRKINNLENNMIKLNEYNQQLVQQNIELNKKFDILLKLLSKDKV